MTILIIIKFVIIIIDKFHINDLIILIQLIIDDMNIHKLFLLVTSCSKSKYEFVNWNACKLYRSWHSSLQVDKFLDLKE